MVDPKDLERRLSSSPFDFLRPAFGLGLYVAWWGGNEVLQQAKHLYFHVIRSEHVRGQDDDGSFSHYTSV